MDNAAPAASAPGPAAALDSAGSAGPGPGAGSASTPTPAPTPAAAPLSRQRVLIVDDEVSFARMVKLNLEKTGQFEVRTENKATYAVAAAREFRPDVILLDVIMPSMDGGDVANQLKHDRHLREIPIIFLTATVSKREAGEGGLNSGGDLFLAKPISVEALIHCIRERAPRAEEASVAAGAGAAAGAAAPAPSPAP
jgi:CheY-like chemotaxis protein